MGACQPLPWPWQKSLLQSLLQWPHSQPARPILILDYENMFFHGFFPSSPHFSLFFTSIFHQPGRSRKIWIIHHFGNFGWHHLLCIRTYIYIYMSTSNPDMRPWRYLPSQSEIIQVIFSYIIIHLHSLYYQSLSLIYWQPNAHNLLPSLKLTCFVGIRSFPFGMAYFQGRAVSFREGISNYNT